MKTKQLLGMAVMAIAMSLCTSSLVAQNNDGKNDGKSDGKSDQSRQRSRGNFDPAQFQQERMNRYKERLEITDETEWNAIKPLVEKVMNTQRTLVEDRMRGMFGSRGGRPGGDSSSQSDQGKGRGGFGGGTPSPESEALRKAIESKASNSELKAAIAKVVESRKSKQAEMEKAQADLRKVLSVRQEALATEAGLL